MTATTFDDAVREVGPVFPAPQGTPEVAADALDCWSVTSILRSLHSYGLEYWKLASVARAAYARRDALATWTEQESVQLLTKQDNWQTDHELSDTACGQEVHRAAEQAVLTDNRDVQVHPEAQPMVRSFYSWLDTYRPEFYAAEVTVCDPEYLFAGTLDAIATMPDGRRWLIDYKTTRNDRDKQGHVRNPYPEWCLQLAAYRYAPLAIPFRVTVPETEQGSPRHYYLTPDDLARAVPMPHIDACAIVQLHPKGWRMWPVRAERDAYDAFLYLRGVTHFIDVVARRSVFGHYQEGTA